MNIIYDGDGNRIQETAAGTTTRYLVAEVNPTGYAQVIEEQAGNGQMTKFYLWGQQLVLATEFTSGFAPQIYGYDGHGSGRYLTDLTGKITDTYDYDAFGNLINSTGTTANNYLFAGEQFDPALGIYYNRARYYDQRQGRFWTMDKLEPDDTDPFTLHRYLFTNANPITNNDPSGSATGISNGNIGAQVQEAIGEAFQAETGGCVDQQIANILENNCDVPITPGLAAPSGLRPDLANPNFGASSTGTVYEIKPVLGAVAGGFQLGGYIRILNRVDAEHRNWHRGTAAEFITQPHIVALGSTSFALVAPPAKGVIAYYVVDLNDGLGVLSVAAILSGGQGAYNAAQIANAARAGRNVISIANTAAAAETAEIAEEVGNTAALTHSHQLDRNQWTMNCIEANRRLEPLRAQFAVRLYRWAEEDLQREIATDFTRVKKIKSSRAFHYLEFLNATAPTKRSEAAFALLRASITHKLARETLRLSLSPAEMEHVSRFQSRFFPVATLSAMEKRLRSNASDELTLDREEFEDILTAEISKKLKAEPLRPKSCIFRQKIGPWYLETGFDVRSIFQFRYGHYITARKKEKPQDLCSVHLKQGGATLGGWLGVHPSTNFNLLRKSEMRETAVFVGDVMRYFVSEVPKLLEGLTHDIPQEIEITKRRTSSKRSNGKPLIM